MPTDAFTHFVFVDFENVPNVDLALVSGKPVQVTLLIGKNQTKIGIGLVQQIRRLAAQVELLEVGASGHNALDLTLAYYLGQAVLRSPAAQFCVVSKDKDFEPLLGHLCGNNLKVGRYESFEALPFLAPPKKPAVVVAKPSVDRRAKIISRLMNPNTPNRPLTKKGLLAKIKTEYGKESSDAKVDDILQELLARRRLTIDAKDKVSYNA